MPFALDRRQFLLGSAATGALALTGCAGMAPRSATADARALYDSIFEGMLRAAPEMATGLGLDTGERAFLKSRLGDASPAGKMGPYRPLIDHMPRLTRIDGWAFEIESARRVLLEQFKTHSLTALGLEEKTAAIAAAGALVQHLRDTQKAGLSHVREIALRGAADCLVLDPSTLRHL